MNLPVKPPVKPMLAKLTKTGMPTGDFLYDPKWDGFRSIIFRDGDEVYIQSRDCKPLLRYFPDLLDPILANLPERCVVDGEIVIATEGALDFDALLLRIHPAKSRVDSLAAESPSSFVAFDMLALDDRDLTGEPFSVRSAVMREAMAKVRLPIHVTPQTDDPVVAQDWFERFEGAGLDGVIAKPTSGIYEPNKRSMLKIKHRRTADCVLAGFRWHKNGPGTEVGSLLLGLHNDKGVLQHVGVASSFSAARRLELAADLEPYRENGSDEHPWSSWMKQAEQSQEGADGKPKRMPGAASRWNRGKNLSWVPLRCERVVEVSYDHMQGDRFRHTTKLVRFRDDKPIADCTYEQLEVTPPLELAEIFAADSSK